MYKHSINVLNVLFFYQEMQKSKLPNSVLGRIWHLSDVDKDGQLDLHEFLLAKHLIQVKLDGYELPAKLPPHLKPPAKDPEANGGCATPGSIMAPPRWGSSANLNQGDWLCGAYKLFNLPVKKNKKKKTTKKETAHDDICNTYIKIFYKLSFLVHNYKNCMIGKKVEVSLRLFVIFERIMVFIFLCKS